MKLCAKLRVSSTGRKMLTASIVVACVIVSWDCRVFMFFSAQSETRSWIWVHGRGVRESCISSLEISATLRKRSVTVGTGYTFDWSVVESTALRVRIVIESDA